MLFAEEKRAYSSIQFLTLTMLPQLGTEDFVYENEDVRSLPGLVEIIQDHDVDSVLHTASVIGKSCQPYSFWL